MARSFPVNVLSRGHAKARPYRQATSVTVQQLLDEGMMQGTTKTIDGNFILKRFFHIKIIAGFLNYCYFCRL